MPARHHHHDPAPERSSAARSQGGPPARTVAKDYVIGHLLAAISTQPDLGSTLVFKGGTALKKLYFGEYRFSEDLDYTAVKAPSGRSLEAALRRAVDEGTRTLSDRDSSPKWTQPGRSHSPRSFPTFRLSRPSCRIFGQPWGGCWR